MAKATIIPVETPGELYCHLQGHQPQPCYIEVDLEEGTISATYDPEIGGGIPKSVWTGHVRRFRIPPLTAEVANATMEEIRPLVETMLDHWDEEWDGSDWRAHLLPEGLRAQEQISELVENPGRWFPEDEVYHLDEGDWFPYVQDEVNTDTTDEQLKELARRTVADLEEGVPSGVLPDEAHEDILERLLSYRDELREELREDDAE